MEAKDQQPYCYTCGASNATLTSLETVGYRTGGGNSFVRESRPVCEDCGKDHTSFLRWGKVIILIGGSLFMAAYVLYASTGVNVF
jgi:hypothetical protein